MAKFKPLNNNQYLLLPPSVEDFIPEGHLARVASEIVDRLNTSKIEDKYSYLGQNTYHPKILLKILFYGYATGTRSGRKISSKCETDTAFMYLAQMYRPDFRTINDFRKNNIQQIENYFVDIIKICQELGMVKVGSISIDGSKIRANASSRLSKDKEGYKRWLERIEDEIKQILKEAEEVDEKEDKKYGDKRGDELPQGLRKREQLKKKIKDVLENFEEEEKKNLTDPDANFMKERAGVISASYNCQLAATENQIIVGADVVTEANDRGELIKMIEQTEDNIDQEVKEIIADSGYGSYNNYEYLAQRKKDGYIPDDHFEQVKNKEYQKEEKKYYKENFLYDKEKDCYTCPEGKTLKFYKKRVSNEGKIKRRQVILIFDSLKK